MNDKILKNDRVLKDKDPLKGRSDRGNQMLQEFHLQLFYLKTLHDFNAEIMTGRLTSDILRCFLMTLMGSFGILRGFVVIFDLENEKVDSYYRRSLEEGYFNKLLELIARYYKNIFLQKGDIAFFDKRDNLSKSSDNIEQKRFFKFLTSHDIHTFVPFSIDKRFSGIIGLGRKINRTPFSSLDKGLLLTLINNLSANLLNQKCLETINELNQEINDRKNSLDQAIKKIQCLENAKNLLFKFVPKSLEKIIENHPEYPDLDKKDIDITVLFLDIEGYTTISEKLEYEEITQLIETYFSYFIDDILKYNGDINLNLGDGLMLIFQDENYNRHAENAVRAAIAIKSKTKIINENMKGFVEPFSLNIGIHSGVACVGANRLDGYLGSRWTYTAIGPTVNIAARISSFARKGDILLSENTLSRVKDKFLFEFLGPQLFKNIKREIRLYRLIKPNCA